MTNTAEQLAAWTSDAGQAVLERWPAEWEQGRNRYCVAIRRDAAGTPCAVRRRWIENHQFAGWTDDGLYTDHEALPIINQSIEGRLRKWAKAHGYYLSIVYDDSTINGVEVMILDDYDHAVAMADCTSKAEALRDASAQALEMDA